MKSKMSLVVIRLKILMVFVRPIVAIGLQCISSVGGCTGSEYREGGDLGSNTDEGSAQ